MSMDDKLAAAKEWLSTRYVCHPVNHIVKGDYATESNRHVDVAKTFARVRARLQGERHED